MGNFKFYLLILASVAVTSLTKAGSQRDVYDMNGAPEHIFLKREHAHQASGGSTSNPQLSYHGGPVLPYSKTMAIFWGNEWNNPSFAGDKISGLNDFFNGFSNSSYAYTGTEYRDSNGFVTASSTFLGSVIDSSSAPTRALKVSGAIAEACKVTGNNPDPNGVYFIFTSTKAGQVNYCAWHSWGTCSNGARIQVAYMPNLDGIAGCDPQDTQTGHSQGLAALANVTAHELLEAITDPRGNAWYDSSGYENADKCAWSFPTVLSTFSNSSVWKLQMEWSNAAYTNGTGLPNRSGQKGCIF